MRLVSLSPKITNGTVALNCPNVECFHFRAARISDCLLESFHFPNLVKLCIQRVKIPEFALNIGKCTVLEELDIRETDIVESDLKFLETCTRLKKLQFFE